MKWRNITQTIQAALPNAEIGANMSPLHFFFDPREGTGIPPAGPDLYYAQMYCPDPFQWIRFFREGGATLPWAEDWQWSTPIGSQQMVTLMVDMLRAGVTKYPAVPDADDEDPMEDEDAGHVARPYTRAPNPPPQVGPPLLMYVLAHFPGNNPIMWKRQMFQDLIHGVKIFDMFDFESSISGYTCDYVDPDGGSYEMVRQSMNELGMMDDIIWNGVAAAGAKVPMAASRPDLDSSSRSAMLCSHTRT